MAITLESLLGIGRRDSAPSCGSELFDSILAKPDNSKPKQIESFSLFSRAISNRPGRLAGFGRGAGQATPEVQQEVVKTILDKTASMDSEDRAIALAIAKIESGFNPDAASAESSAAGVFQFIRKTGSAFGLSDDNVFDADSNIDAGVAYLRQGIKAVDSRFKAVDDDTRAALIYSYHHDGGKDFGISAPGYKIAVTEILPGLDAIRDIVPQWP